LARLLGSEKGQPNSAVDRNIFLIEIGCLAASLGGGARFVSVVVCFDVAENAVYRQIIANFAKLPP
jgi:hypothetical protein